MLLVPLWLWSGGFTHSQQQENFSAWCVVNIFLAWLRVHKHLRGEQINKEQLNYYFPSLPKT